MVCGSQRRVKPAGGGGQLATTEWVATGRGLVKFNREKSLPDW